MGHSIGHLLDAHLAANKSKFSDQATANTSEECSKQRASALWKAGTSKVLELCVGPSLSCLEKSYNDVAIECWGNDIDGRWRKHYPHGKWIIGDANEVARNHHQIFDAMTFAPPLSSGCSGKREDSLMIDEVMPSYTNFVSMMHSDTNYNGLLVLVLPGRCLATKDDRDQFFKLCNFVHTMYADVVRMDIIDGCRKYVELHIKTRL